LLGQRHIAFHLFYFTHIGKMSHLSSSELLNEKFWSHVVLGVLVTIFLLLTNQSREFPIATVELIKQSYEGIIVEKKQPINSRNFILDLKIMTIEDTFCLQRISDGHILEVGDSVFKQSSSIFLLFARKGVRDSVQLVYHIDDWERNHPSWPNEWRDRWPELSVPYPSMFSKLTNWLCVSILFYNLFRICQCLFLLTAKKSRS
jgi:hypothetical protein